MRSLAGGCARPIQVGSHFHFFEANEALNFDRKQAWGKRLDIAAGTAVRFEAGQTLTVKLIDMGGKRRVFGFNNMVNGFFDGIAREHGIPEYPDPIDRLNL